MFKRSKNFTLMELLIVIAIIGLIAAIASPKMSETINDAREAKFNGNVASILSALNLYMAHNEGMFQRTTDGTTVAACVLTRVAAPLGDGPGTANTVYPASSTELLAYLETTALEYNEIDGGRGGFVIGAVYDPDLTAAGTNDTPAGEVLTEGAVCNTSHVRVFALPDVDNNQIPGDGTDGLLTTGTNATTNYATYIVGTATNAGILVYDSTTDEGLVPNIWATVGTK